MNYFWIIGFKNNDFSQKYNEERKMLQKKYEQPFQY